MSSTKRDDRDRRELAVARYVEALDDGDADALGRVLAEALDDPELDRMLAAVDTSMHQEAGLPTFAENAQLVRRLLVRHLPEGLTQPAEPEPVSVRDVAARIQSDVAFHSLPASDRLLNQRLLMDERALPTPLTASGVARLVEALVAEGSARYWELFRRLGVTLTVARQHDRIELAAARHRSARRARQRPEAGS